MPDELPDWFLRDDSSNRADTLIAGPYLGEFGFELMLWQGYVRRLRRHYSRTIVVSYAHSGYLYEGCEFVSHGLSLAQSGYGIGKTPEALLVAAGTAFAQENGIGAYDQLTGPLIRRRQRLLGWSLDGQDFLVFHEPVSEERRYDVVFHFRSFVRVGPVVEDKNYPADAAEFLVQECRRLGYSVACVGHPELSSCPQGAVDERFVDLRETVRVISNARLVVGGSSGAMHLASLCARPIVVWIGPPVGIDIYLTHWNPHRSPVYVVSDRTFQPPPVDVLGVIEKAIAGLRA